jgi:hypothetical protein
MGKMRLPASLRQFVERQSTVPVTDLWNGDSKERSPRTEANFVRRSASWSRCPRRSRT